MRPEGFAVIEKTPRFGHALLALPQPVILLPHRFSVNLGLVKLLRPMLKWLRVNTRGGSTRRATKRQIDAFRSMFAGRDVKRVWAYSDSINDRFYLNMLTMPLPSIQMIA